MLSNKKWKILFFIATILVALSVIPATGCESGNDADLTFTYSELADATAIDPALVDESVGSNITKYLFDGLVAYDSDTGEIKEAVAKDWKVNDDATEFTFEIRKGVNFSNGREVKAEDFVYSWTRALDPETGSPMAMDIFEPVKGATAFAMGEADSVEGIEAVDDYTVKVTLEYPLAEFVTFLSHPVASPVPQEEVENAEGNFSEKPVGNGPFVLTEWKPNEYIKMERNDDYYGDKAEVGAVEMKVIPSSDTAVAELKAGNVDAVKSAEPSQIETLRDDESVEIYEQDVAATRFIAFNNEQDPWKGNEKLRQVLNWAVDRETIASKVLQGQAHLADGIVPAGLPGHQDNAMPYTFDQEKAKALLNESGYPGGQGLPPLTLTYPAQGPASDVAQAVQSSLQDIGIQVELDGLEYGAFLDEMLAGNISMFMISWQADYPSVDTFLYPLFHSEGGRNVMFYANSDVDTLLDTARSALDKDDRLDAYNEAERDIMADAPIVPLVFLRDTIVYSPDVTRMVYTPLGDIALNEIIMSK